MFFIKNLLFLFKIINSKKIIFSALLVLIFTVFQSITPLLNLEITKQLLNFIQKGTTSNKIIVLFVFLLLIQLISEVINSINVYFTQIFKLKIDNIVTEMIMRQTSSIKHEDILSSVIQEKLYFLRTQSTAKISSMFLSFISIFSSVITFFSMFIYLFNWNPWYAFISTFLSIPGGIIQLYFNKKEFSLMQNLSRHRREQFYLLFISTTKEYIREITEHRSMKYLIDLHLNLFKLIIKPTSSLLIRQRISYLFAGFLGLSGIGYTEYQTLKLVINGDILLGTFTSILQALGQVSGGTQKLIISLSGVHSDWLYARNLRGFMDLKFDDKLESTKNQKKLNKPITLEAKNLSYIVGEKSIFEGLNFEFSVGSIIGITGANGSGKSTLLEIILGIRKATKGQLLFNKVPSDYISDKQRVNLCQMLYQQPQKYEFTLSENIGIADVEQLIDQNDKILEYIVSLDEKSFLFNSDLQDNTRLGEWYEESRSLSGGQWQRIALYRLFYRKAPIYLLDEPTNNLDNSSIELLEKMLKNVSNTSLILIVSHDTKLLERICTDIYELKQSSFKHFGSTYTTANNYN